MEAERIHAPKNQRGMAASIKPTKRSGDVVVEAKGLSVGFEDGVLFDGLDWTVRWGDRWGVIGENGAGKSTLVRTVLGRRAPLDGSVKLGSNVEVGYFAQDAQEIDLDLSPLQFMCYECGMDSGPARDMLGRFLIEGDDVFRPIKTLSGGEKNKLSLARLCWESPNLLVLDEPTNHLDMASREALAEVLKEYRGTMVLVSHDRWLLKQVATSILDVRRSGCIQFPGSYEEYRRRTAQPSSTARSKPVPKGYEGLSPREKSKAIEQLKRSVAECEERVSSLESALASLESELASPPPGADLVALSERHAALKAQVEGAVHEWEREAETLAALE